MIELGLRALKPGGIFIAFTPNASEEARARSYSAWHKSWGFVHPQLIDAVYLRKAFPGRTILVASSPYPLAGLASYHFDHPQYLDLCGDELLFALKKERSSRQ